MFGKDTKVNFMYLDAPLAFIDFQIQKENIRWSKNN